MTGWPFVIAMAGPAGTPPAPRRRRPLQAAPPPRARARGWWPRITRDALLFATGLGLVLHEALVRDGDPRTQLLILYAGMIGLPAVFQADGALAQLLRRDPPK